MTISSRIASVDDYLQYVELRGARTKILGQSTPLRRSAVAIGGAKRQSRARLPDFFNQDCDDNGSGFGRSAYEMRR
jgi:hypothetical protein